MASYTKRTRNFWPFGSGSRKPKPKGTAKSAPKARTCGVRAGTTAGEAIKAARKAGVHLGDTGGFRDWLCERGLQDRGNALVSRLRREFELGVETGRETDAPATKAPAKYKGSAYTRTGKTFGKAPAGYKGYQLRRTEAGQWYSSLDRDSHYDTQAEAKRAIDDYTAGRNPRRSPGLRRELGGGLNAFDQVWKYTGGLPHTMAHAALGTKSRNPDYEIEGETVPSEIPLFAGLPADVGGEPPIVEYTTLNEAVAYAQAIKGLCPDVGVVGLEDGAYGVVVDSAGVRAADEAEATMELGTRSNPDDSLRSPATDTAEREGMGKGVTDAQYFRPMKSQAEALEHASPYVKHYAADIPSVGDFYYQGYTHGYRSGASSVAKFSIGPFSKKEAQREAESLKRRGFEELELAKSKGELGTTLYHIHGVSRDTRKHPLPYGAQKRNPAGADDAHYAAQLQTKLQHTQDPREAAHLRALLKFYATNGRLPQLTDSRADWRTNPGGSVVRYYVQADARTVRGHWRVYEVLVGADGKETQGRMVADKPTKKAATETAGKLNRKLGRRNPRRRNGLLGPEDTQDDADDLYERFHGAPSTEVIEMETEVIEPDHLAVLGPLVSLVIGTPTGYEVTLGFDENPPYLCSTTDGRQLYVEGGNQSVDLKSLEMGGKDWERQNMLLGELLETTYRTQKKFDKFQTIDYYHANGEESGIAPSLVYDPINNLLTIVGGRYKVKPEGIVD